MSINNSKYSCSELPLPLLRVISVEKSETTSKNDFCSKIVILVQPKFLISRYPVARLN
jgi:hypothetical protein